MLFAAGSVLAAAAGGWGMLLAARALQGSGNGVLVAVAYVAIARGYDGALHARMLALLSSAWIIPSIAGPALAGALADAVSWRLAFLALLPVLAGSAVVATAGLQHVGRAPAAAGGAAGRGRAAGTLGAGFVLVAGTGLVLAGLDVEGRPLVLAALVVAGLGLTSRPLRRLLPAGTLRGAAGLPSAVAARGLLAGAFLGIEAFVPLGLTTLRDLSAAQAGLVMTAGSLSWSAASFGAARLDSRDAARGRGRRLTVAAAALAAGVALAGAGVAAPGLPLVVVVLGWCVAGGGIGASYATVAAAAFARTPAGAEGEVSSALQLIETLAIALVTGALGALVGAGVSGGQPSETALAAVFAAGSALALTAAVLARRAAGSPR